MNVSWYFYVKLIRTIGIWKEKQLMLTEAEGIGHIIGNISGLHEISRLWVGIIYIMSCLHEITNFKTIDVWTETTDAAPG